MRISRKRLRRFLSELFIGENILRNRIMLLGNTLSYNFIEEYDVQVKRDHFYGLEIDCVHNSNVFQLT